MGIILNQESYFSSSQIVFLIDRLASRIPNVYLVIQENLMQLFGDVFTRFHAPMASHTLDKIGSFKA